MDFLVLIADLFNPTLPALAKSCRQDKTLLIMVLVGCTLFAGFIGMLVAMAN
ncbi:MULTISPECIES: hypothetical protein [Shewanella]|uniref:hypothetical protein n=1 Tax=Shewanella TaxID=22 RepID=UPI0002EDBBCE|nr:MULTISPECIES: hypothetical protein [unclassified Shewanella]